jgi:hypothetical protein
VVVPALALHLERATEFPVVEPGRVLQQHDAITALAEFGPEATAALPVLQKIARNRDDSLYFEALRCLQLIAPEVPQKEQ